MLILTNDGDLSQQLMHPSKSIEKEYLVTSNQAFENSHLDQFLEGVYTPEGKLKAKSIERLSPRRLSIVLDHGAKRQIRVMFETLGYQVTKLLRVRVGGLWLGARSPLGDSLLADLHTGRAERRNFTLADGSQRVAGDALIDAVNEVFQTQLPDDEFETIGGLVAHELGRVPRRGESVDVGGLRFVVMLARGGAVRWFKVTRAPDMAPVAEAG
mgnify:CR=1 FL=1